MIWLVKRKPQIPAKERELSSSAAGYMQAQEEELLVANKKKIIELRCMERTSKCLNLKRPRVRSIAVAKRLQLYPA